jgi:hypothetical protein
VDELMKKELRKRPETQQERRMRDMYVRSKGVENPAQFTLDFELMKNDALRAMPNDFVRSALFTTSDKRAERKAIMRKSIYHLHGDAGLEVIYTGHELRVEDDQKVYMQILHYARDVPFGTPFKFTILDLMQNIGWSSQCEENYSRARDSILRLMATALIIKNQKSYGSSAMFSLIDRGQIINDKEGKEHTYTLSIDPICVLLFAGGTFTSQRWSQYLALRPVEVKLLDYARSNRKSFDLSLKDFEALCGSNYARKSDWTRRVRAACAVLVEAGHLPYAEVTSDKKITFSPPKLPGSE